MEVSRGKFIFWGLIMVLQLSHGTALYPTPNPYIYANNYPYQAPFEPEPFTHPLKEQFRTPHQSKQFRYPSHHSRPLFGTLYRPKDNSFDSGRFWDTKMRPSHLKYKYDPDLYNLRDQFTANQAFSFNFDGNPDGAKDMSLKQMTNLNFNDGKDDSTEKKEKSKDGQEPETESDEKPSPSETKRNLKFDFGLDSVLNNLTSGLNHQSKTNASFSATEPTNAKLAFNNEQRYSSSNYENKVNFDFSGRHHDFILDDNDDDDDLEEEFSKTKHVSTLDLDVKTKKKDNHLLIASADFQITIKPNRESRESFYQDPTFGPDSNLNLPNDTSSELLSDLPNDANPEGNSGSSNGATPTSEPPPSKPKTNAQFHSTLNFAGNFGSGNNSKSPNGSPKIQFGFNSENKFSFDPKRRNEDEEGQQERQEEEEQQQERQEEEEEQQERQEEEEQQLERQEEEEQVRHDGDALLRQEEEEQVRHDGDALLRQEEEQVRHDGDALLRQVEEEEKGDDLLGQIEGETQLRQEEEQQERQEEEEQQLERQEEEQLERQEEGEQQERQEEEEQQQERQEEGEQQERQEEEQQERQEEEENNSDDVTFKHESDKEVEGFLDPDRVQNVLLGIKFNPHHRRLPMSIFYKILLRKLEMFRKVIGKSHLSFFVLPLKSDKNELIKFYKKYPEASGFLPSKLYFNKKHQWDPTMMKIMNQWQQVSLYSLGFEPVSERMEFNKCFTRNQRFGMMTIDMLGKIIKDDLKYRYERGQISADQFKEQYREMKKSLKKYHRFLEENGLKKCNLQRYNLRENEDDTNKLSYENSVNDSTTLFNTVRKTFVVQKEN